jgi:hypothetical protein
MTPGLYEDVVLSTLFPLQNFDELNKHKIVFTFDLAFKKKTVSRMQPRLTSNS